MMRWWLFLITDSTIEAAYFAKVTGDVCTVCHKSVAEPCDYRARVRAVTVVRQLTEYSCDLCITDIMYCIGAYSIGVQDWKNKVKDQTASLSVSLYLCNG